MEQQDPQQFTAAVSRAAQYPDLDLFHCCLHVSTRSEISSHSRSPPCVAFAARIFNSLSINSTPISVSVTDPATTSAATPFCFSNSTPPQAPTKSLAQKTSAAVASRNSASSKID